MSAAMNIPGAGMFSLLGGDVLADPSLLEGEFVQALNLREVALQGLGEIRARYVYGEHEGAIAHGQPFLVGALSRDAPPVTTAL